MVIEDTPSLERLLVLDQVGPTRINVMSAPKLIAVGYSSVKYYYFQVKQLLYLSFLISTLFLVFKMYVCLSSNKASSRFWA